MTLPELIKRLEELRLAVGRLPSGYVDGGPSKTSVGVELDTILFDLQQGGMSVNYQDRGNVVTTTVRVPR